jgi:hypothetical protein
MLVRQESSVWAGVQQFLQQFRLLIMFGRAVGFLISHMPRIGVCLTHYH